MSDTNAVECAVAMEAPRVEIDGLSGRLIPRVKTIPWKRVLVDALLIAAIVLASSSFLTVR